MHNRVKRFFIMYFVVEAKNHEKSCLQKQCGNITFVSSPENFPITLKRLLPELKMDNAAGAFKEAGTSNFLDHLCSSLDILLGPHCS